jgi:hypothetical protein
MAKQRRNNPFQFGNNPKQSTNNATNNSSTNLLKEVMSYDIAMALAILTATTEEVLKRCKI